MQFSCIVFGWTLPNDSEIYKKYYRFVRKVTISNLLNDIQSYKLCDGVDNINSMEPEQHLIPGKVNLNDIIDGSPSQAKLLIRSMTCKILQKSVDTCISCHCFQNEHEKRAERRKHHLETPAKSIAPLSQAHCQRVELA